MKRYSAQTEPIELYELRLLKADITMGLTIDLERIEFLMNEYERLIDENQRLSDEADQAYEDGYDEGHYQDQRDGCDCDGCTCC